MQENNLAEKLYELRKTNALSQDELADKLNVSRQAISKWERGESLPDTENLIQLSKLYNVSIDELVGLKCDENETGTADNLDINLIEDIDEDEGDLTTKSNWSITTKILVNLPFPIIITIAFLIWGFTLQQWHIAWTLFLTIPIYYSIVESIISKRFNRFAYPIFATFIYLIIGMSINMWHPTWIIFITIPVYYIIADIIDRNNKK